MTKEWIPLYRKGYCGLEVEKLLEEKGGIRLDIGCGYTPQKGFVTLDKSPDVKPDIVHDLEVFPYPLPDGCCLMIVGSHIIEHIKPWLTLDFINELWRIMKVGGQLAMSTPWAGSTGYYQDPTHCNPCNAATFQYFDPRYPLYQVYKPKPWLIEKGFPTWQMNGSLEVILEKIGEILEPVDPQPTPDKG
jgi:hypothetical protein